METFEEEDSPERLPPRPSDKRRRIFVLLGCGILQLPIWGIPMTFGIFQEAYSSSHVLAGSQAATGVIGTTMNGVMYISMPFLAAFLETQRWASWRRPAAILGLLLSCAGFLASSWSNNVWQLILLQSVVAALGSAVLYVATTLWVNDWFRDNGRATAYGVQLSSKNIVGTACPFIIYILLQRLGFRGALRVWTAIALATGLMGIALIPSPPSTASSQRPRKIPWSFLRHKTFYIYAAANTLFSSGYGLPQTYLSTYASSILHLRAAESALTISIFNAPGIISCTGFGLLSDRAMVSAGTNTFISAFGSAACVFLLWALKSHQLPGVLIAFSLGYGFFAGGYSATWGGWIKELEMEAAANNEAVSAGTLYGLYNGARGIGYVAGGLSGVELLKVGAVQSSQKWALGTKYGALILFTGISSILGGWSVLFGGCDAARRRWRRG